MSNFKENPKVIKYMANVIKFIIMFVMDIAKSITDMVKFIELAIDLLITKDIIIREIATKEGKKHFSSLYLVSSSLIKVNLVMEYSISLFI